MYHEEKWLGMIPVPQKVKSVVSYQLCRITFLADIFSIRILRLEDWVII